MIYKRTLLEISGSEKRVLKRPIAVPAAKLRYPRLRYLANINCLWGAVKGEMSLGYNSGSRD